MYPKMVITTFSNEDGVEEYIVACIAFSDSECAAVFDWTPCDGEQSSAYLPRWQARADALGIPLEIDPSATKYLEL